MNSGLTSGLASAPLRTPIARRTNGQGLAVGNSIARAKNSICISGPLPPDAPLQKSSATGANSISIGNSISSGAQSICIGAGYQTLASGGGSVAIGANARAIENGDLALGGEFGQEGPIASGGASVAIMGRSSTASGTRSFSAGMFTTASATHSHAFGYFAVASANHSFASGEYVTANRYGEFARSSGVLITAAGAPRLSLFTAFRSTTNDTPTELFLSGLSSRLTITSGTGFSATIKVLGMKSDGTVAATYLRKAAIKNVGGLTELIGSVETIGTDLASGTSISITADDTNDSLKIEVTGVSAQTWNWAASIESIQLGFAG